MKNAVTSAYGTEFSFCLSWWQKTAELINSFFAPEYAIQVCFFFLSSGLFVEEVCVKADLDTVIPFISLWPALLKQAFSFLSKPAPTSCSVPYDCTCLQGKWVGRYIKNSQFKVLQQVIKDFFKSEEGNCLSPCKRFIIRKESTGIKKNYPGSCGRYLQAGGNSVPGRRRHADS